MSNMIIGYDKGEPGGDYTVIQYWKTPGRLRKLLRRIGLDRSMWERKLVKEKTIRG